ncbi:hypothetical protein GN277_23450 [Lachnospiraceae bacterium WCA-9-b2]|uniref:Uncharacterized protein n=1 Tax=Sporofaciens musculi TaxID=2681861 RepID=A0A7X3MKQ5_9FIRM|nr:hypothetical protein [Sporofaciens musculi]MCI9423558.1 hypothetical protein [Dorea sp.]MXP78203.1 hypothetical protein [Sporofaciens musculi]
MEKQEKMIVKRLRKKSEKSQKDMNGMHGQLWIRRRISGEGYMSVEFSDAEAIFPAGPLHFPYISGIIMSRLTDGMGRSWRLQASIPVLENGKRTTDVAMELENKYN